MKSLEIKFRKIAEKNPDLSSYVCFARTVTGQKYNSQTIHRWFQKLVEKDDYAKNEKRALLAHLENLSNPLRTTEFGGKTPPTAIILPKTH